MTPDELNDALDAMQDAAGDDADKRPGLIVAQVEDWINHLADLQTTKPKTIVDGIRIREIKVAVDAIAATKILTRAEADDRGEPYRDLAARA